MKNTQKNTKQAALLASLAREGASLRADALEADRQMWAKRAAAALLGKPMPVKL